MNRTGSLNAVMATQQQTYHTHSHSPILQQSPSHSQAQSPTSGTPSFSWPRRVRSPEPHVPLRKASPQRLHSRRAAPPPPLLLTIGSRSQGHALIPNKAHAVPVSPYRGKQQLYPDPERDDRAYQWHQSQANLTQPKTPSPLESSPTPVVFDEYTYSDAVIEAHADREIGAEEPEKVSWPLPVENGNLEHQHRSQHDQNQRHYHHRHNQRKQLDYQNTQIHQQNRFQQTQPQPQLQQQQQQQQQQQERHQRHHQYHYQQQQQQQQHHHQQHQDQQQKQQNHHYQQQEIHTPIDGKLSDHEQYDRCTPSPQFHRKTGQLKTSQSMQEGLRSAPRDRLFSTASYNPEYRERRSPVARNISTFHRDAEEVRTSFRSALTSTSSHNESTVRTSGSSIATADSTFSDCVKIERVATRDSSNSRAVDEDSDFDVDDALDLYAAGFDSPVASPTKETHELSPNHELNPNYELSPNHELTRSGSFPRGSFDSTRSNLRAHPSPLASNGRNSSRVRGRDNLHRRSRSASAVDFNRIRIQEAMNNPPVPVPAISPSTVSPAINKQPPSPMAAEPDPFVPPSPVPRDRYGFKKQSHYIKLEKFDEWEKRYNTYLVDRRVKWDGLMRKYGLTTNNPTRFPAKTDKVKKYVRKGIPPEWRGAAWFWYAGGPNKLAQNPGLYRKLLQQVNQGKLSDNDREHIERDLNRTFPDNIRFKPDPTSSVARDSHTDTSKAGAESGEPETDMVRALRRVLQAFAVHNPNIGYCQSLNFIAGLLLIFLDADEEKTFILLNVVTTEHLPGTHGVALEGANIDIAVLMTSIRESIPSVWTKLDDRQPSNSVMSGGAPRLPTVSLATTAWFMSLFVGTLPIECVLRVWDCLFFEGSKTLFRVALAIFKIGEPQIRAINDPMEVFQEVQSMPRKLVDANMLMETCFKKGRHGFGGLSQDVVEKRREDRRKDVREGRALTTDESSIGSHHGGMGKAIARAKSKTRFKRH